MFKDPTLFLTCRLFLNIHLPILNIIGQVSAYFWILFKSSWITLDFKLCASPQALCNLKLNRFANTILVTALPVSPPIIKEKEDFTAIQMMPLSPNSLLVL